MPLQIFPKSVLLFSIAFMRYFIFMVFLILALVLGFGFAFRELGSMGVENPLKEPLFVVDIRFCLWLVCDCYDELRPDSTHSQA